ncbi:MAG: DUF4835 family protein [Reichenbachiella sp.]
MKNTKCKILATFFLIIFSWSLSAQELNCRVSVNSQQIETTERGIFDQMESEFANFLNDQKWSEERFDGPEKIKCMVQITLESQPEIGFYNGAVQVISVRPIYNTNYETTIINFADRDFNFEYTEGQPLNFNEASYSSNITSILGFYANVVLAYDFDSFENLGGDRHFDKAWQTVLNAQSSNYGGWDQFNSIRNRYWWAENALDPIMRPFREAMYEYHIKGMDLMAENPDEARTNILEAIKKIYEVNRSKPRSIMVISFLDSKSDEIVSVFSQGDMAMRRQAYDLLRQMDPSKTEVFRTILTN